MKRSLALIALAVAACAPLSDTTTSTTAPSARATTSSAPSPSGSPTTQMLVAGKVTTAVPDRDQYAAFAAGGSLYAIYTRESIAPHLSRIHRWSEATRTWDQVYESDTHFLRVAAEGARAGLVEYREVPIGGGANDQRVAVLDLVTGKAATIDAFALSAKTFHGGGGGPRHPVAGVALGGDRVAWTRINELADGVTEGELRIAMLSDPSRFTTIGKSTEWIEPLWMDSSRLVYLVGGAQRDDIRTRDLVSGVDRSVVTALAPRQSAGRAGIAHSGDVLAWIDNPSLPGAPDARPGDPTTTVLHTVDLSSGSSQDLDLGTSYCVGLTGNATGLVWSCPSKAVATTFSYFDPRARQNVDILRSSDRPNDLQAVAGGFLWFDVVNGVRRANLLTLP